MGDISITKIRTSRVARANIAVGLAPRHVITARSAPPSLRRATWATPDRPPALTLPERAEIVAVIETDTGLELTYGYARAQRL